MLFLRIGTASVWILFGLAFKVFGLAPRHRLIVATFFGEGLAGPLTAAIGLAEAGMGLWILSGYRPRLCAAAQTAAIVIMNTLEIAFARHLLLAPLPMVGANALLLAAAWYIAWRAPRRPA